ncbi:siderophore-interacting protein [Actinoallomurus acaciae]|uniref:Siderophore-interacting protein n=1 Tax=Actinoallomurus acaciae TaxID=502577 RepID=A0ABV5YJF1_9ACTN
MLPPPGRDRPDLPTAGPDGMPAYAEGAVPPTLRACTVRRFDPAVREMDVDVAAEAEVVHTLRRHLVDERGPALRAAAYWKAGRTGDERDREVMAAFQAAVAAGADPAVTLEADLA